MTDAFLDATAQAELVRTGEVSALELVDDAIARVEKLDPELPLGRVRTIQQLTSESVQRPRFRTTLLVLFVLPVLYVVVSRRFGDITGADTPEP